MTDQSLSFSYPISPKISRERSNAPPYSTLDRDDSRCSWGCWRKLKIA